MNREQQQFLFEPEGLNRELDSRMWHGSFNGRESTLQQLSPYVGKIKSGMARTLIEFYSKCGDIILDPFSGSGVIPFEAALLGRVAMANDLSPYAYVLTRGKLAAPEQFNTAIQRAEIVCQYVEQHASSVDTDSIPEWILEFYHPRTLNEIVAAFSILHEEQDYFLMACLLGIMHHVRPGFLSYPASHLVPYLRKTKFSPDQFPGMYTYRDLRSRLLAKVKRAYRHALLPINWKERSYTVWQVNSMQLPIADGSVDTIISSPPYFGALDYARDNRLRLWFLGCKDWRKLDSSLTASKKVYLQQMRLCLGEMFRVLKSNGYCILILGDVDKNGKLQRTAEILGDLAIDVTQGQFVVQNIYDDCIPNDRRSRRQTKTTLVERVLVMSKKSLRHQDAKPINNNCS